VKLLDLFQKYVSLRPSNLQSTWFFYQFYNGKGSCQVVGINMIRKVPCEIAMFLDLSEPLLFTSHSFRCSSVSWLADAGGDKDIIIMAGGNLQQLQKVMLNRVLS
jgi:hypothetical protein